MTLAKLIALTVMDEGRVMKTGSVYATKGSLVTRVACSARLLLVAKYAAVMVYATQTSCNDFLNTNSNFMQILGRRLHVAVIHRMCSRRKHWQKQPKTTVV